MKATSASLVVIRTRLRRLVKGIDAHVGRRLYGAQHRSDAAVWKYLRKRVDAELRQRDAAWQGYTAGLSEAQVGYAWAIWSAGLSAFRCGWS